MLTVIPFLNRENARLRKCTMPPTSKLILEYQLHDLVTLALDSMRTAYPKTNLWGVKPTLE